MSKIIAVLNKKGGVGKTTTALAMTDILQEQGKKVLLIDLDSQCNATSTMQAAATSKNAFSLLLKTVDASETIQHTPNGDIIPASEQLSKADLTITEVGKEYRLKEALVDLKDTYDYIIIDTPPSFGILIVNALTAAEEVIITAKAEIYSADGLINLYKYIELTKKYCNPTLKIDGILLTQYDARKIASRNLKGMFEQIAEQIETKVFDTYIRQNVALQEAQIVKKMISKYDKNSNGYNDYNDFIKEYLK